MKDRDLARGVAVILFFVAGCHTSPIEQANYGAIGPRFPGPEAVIDGDTSSHSVQWTENGGGIAFLGDCLTNQSSRGRVSAPAISMIPAVGGSISWQRCELTHSTAVPRDSAGRFDAFSLGADGRLLYLESVTAITGVGSSPFPIFTHADLWLTDSTYPLSRRTKLLALYHDSLGFATVPDTQVNWLLDINWAGPKVFVAKGANLLARLGVYQPTVLHLVRGEIGQTGATLSPIVGTDNVRLYSLAKGGTAVVFTRDSLQIEQAPIDGTGATSVVLVPSAINRSIADISCRQTFCLVVTQENAAGGQQSTFWTLDLANGRLATLQTYPAAISTAKISPTSSAVLVFFSGRLHLFTELLN